ncbi:MAG TPA: GreA/GreB family elongation factor [Gaiellaceae bacterium]|nr:GreA/GreB family elongation factor [Gaiellaceae bacterium]
MSGRLPTAELVRAARDGEAEVGERVTVLDLTTSDVHDYRLVEPDGVHVADGTVSIRAPLGSALLGRHVGDVVSVEDGDRLVRLEVVEIDG